MTSNRDEGLFSELRRHYIAQVPAKISAIQDVIENGDLESIESLAHKLRGSGRSYGFSEITDIAAEIEFACRDRRIHEVQQLLIRLKNILTELIDKQAKRCD